MRCCCPVWFAPLCAAPISLVSLLLSWLPVAQCAARTYSAYFRLLIRLARSRSDLRRWMIEQGAIAALVDFYTCNTAVPQFNCRVSPPVLSYIVQQQQVAAPKSLHDAYTTLMASFAASSNTAAVRRMHPYHGHLAITLLALLVQHKVRTHSRKQQPRYTTLHHTREAELACLNTESDMRSHTGVIARRVIVHLTCELDRLLTN